MYFWCQQYQKNITGFHTTDAQSSMLLILTNFTEKFVHALYDQYFIKCYKTLKERSHGIPLYIYKIIQMVSTSAVQQPENGISLERFTICSTAKCRSHDLLLAKADTERDWFDLLLKIINIQSLAHVWEVEIMDIGCLICMLLFLRLKGRPFHIFWRRGEWHALSIHLCGEGDPSGTPVR